MPGEGVRMQGRQQQDAQDLLHILLESIESEEKKMLAVKQRREQSQSQKPAGELGKEVGEKPGLCCPPEHCWQAVSAASLCCNCRAPHNCPPYAPQKNSLNLTGAA